MRNRDLRKFLRTSIAVALLLATLPSEARAQQIPPPVDLGVPLIRQETDVWCWLAVAEMIARYRNSGRSLRQCEMLEIGFGLPPGACCGNPMACRRPATGMQELQTVLARLGGVIAIHMPPLTPADIYAALRSGHPVIAQIRTGMASSHVVVIRGMRWGPMPVMTPYGVMMNVEPVLLVNDPMSFLPTEVPYRRLAAIWMDTLIVR